MTRATPKWLKQYEIIVIHAELLQQDGGSAGVRDWGLLRSALAAPKNKYAYGKPGIFDLAAGYAHALTRNHPFIDGNKRIAFMAAYTFLGLNGWDFIADEVRVVHMVLALTTKEISEREFADWLKRNSSRTHRSISRKLTRHHLRHSRKKR